MRMTIFFAALAALSSPAAAQKPTPGQNDPSAYLRESGLAPDPERVRAAIEAAQASPLGSMENPVRVGGPNGERGYIARLRCADGLAPRVGNRGNTGVGVFGTIVDVYPLDCGDAAPGRVNLVMDMYHPSHAETRAPSGFTLQR